MKSLHGALILSLVWRDQEHPPTCDPRTELEFARTIERACDSGALLLEGTPLHRLVNPTFLAFTTTEHWSFRRYKHSRRWCRVANNVLTVITSSEDLIPEDLSRRVKMIELMGRASK